MAAIGEIAAVMEAMAPKALAEDWDNVGTLVDCGGDVTSILVALDITNEVVEEAEAKGCQLIISHHPVIFTPLRSVRHGEVVYRLIRKNISALCAHTNLDAAAGGVNDVLAALFGVANPEALEGGIGRVGRLRQAQTVPQLAALCHSRLAAEVKYTDTGRQVQTLAVLGGAGGGMVQQALLAGADCLLTGEADHHDAIDARQLGLSLIVAGHFSTEFPVVPVLAERLRGKLKGVKIRTSRRNRDPFRYFVPAETEEPANNSQSKSN